MLKENKKKNYFFFKTNSLVNNHFYLNLNYLYKQKNLQKNLQKKLIFFKKLFKNNHFSQISIIVIFVFYSNKLFSSNYKFNSKKLYSFTNRYFENF